jgi:hypothetical protein
MQNTKITVRFFNNKLIIDRASNKDSEKISNLWSELREDYIDWVSDVRLKKFGMRKSLVELLEWKKMSTWWLNPITTKDIDIDNRWLHQLMVIYLFKSFPGRLDFKTDDNLLVKAIYKNFQNVSDIVCQEPLQDNIKKHIKFKYKKLYKSILILFSFFQTLKKWIILFRFRNTQKERFKSLLPSVWFRTIFPASWIQSSNGNWYDRHYTNAPLDDIDNGQVARYIVYLTQYENNVGFLKLWREVNNIESKTKREVAFPEAHLTLQDIFGSYITTFHEWRFFNKLRCKKSFRDLFKIKDLDLSDILLGEWETIYFGEMQLYKLNGLAVSNFLGEMDHPHTIATYGEFFSQVRAEYHLSSIISPNSKFVAIQHAMNVKSKMFTYYRKNEISQINSSNHIKFLPITSNFLVQGKQYSEILSEFYPSDNVKLIGCLKYDSYSNISNNGTNIDKNINKRMILIAPSVNDYQSIVDIFSSWKEKISWEVVLSPHPATDVRAIKSYQRKKHPNLKIIYNTTSRTSDLMANASLIVTGQSTMAIEANFYSIRAIRFINLGSFPMFDYEEVVPVFYNGESFIEWFDRQDWEGRTGGIKKSQRDIISRYFYKIDGEAANRMWAFLNELDLPHNQINYEN